MRKPAFCICKNKDVDQLHGTIPLLPKFQASRHLLYLYSLVCVGPGRKPECWFSHDAAHIIIMQYFSCFQLTECPRDRADLVDLDYNKICFYNKIFRLQHFIVYQLFILKSLNK